MVTNNAVNNDIINGDSGSASGRPITFNAQTNAGATVKFSGSGSTISLLTSDSNTNTFVGSGSGNTSLTQSQNTAIGHGNLPALTTTGGNNTACGCTCLTKCTTGQNNAALGVACLFFLTTGSQNLAIGTAALESLTTGSYNTGLGYQAGASYTGGETNNTCIGGNVTGVAGESNALRIGEIAVTSTCFIAGISGITVTGAAVLVSSGSQLGVAVSSIKYKENVQPMGDISSKLLECQPVTFNYKEDKIKHTHFGMIAEDVQKIIPELVLSDDEGNPMTIAYHEMPPMLLNELIKLRARVEELERKAS
jgi:hypothetical protein